MNIENLIKTKDLHGLIKALLDNDKDIREKAAEALGIQGDKCAIPPLIACLSDVEPHVRMAAVNALAKFRLPETVEPLGILLKDPDYCVRRTVVDALGKISNSRVKELLLIAVDDTDYIVQLIAAQSLASAGDPRGMERLNAAINNQPTAEQIQAQHRVEQSILAKEEEAKQVRNEAGKNNDQLVAEAKKCMAQSKWNDAKTIFLESIQVCERYQWNEGIQWAKVQIRICENQIESEHQQKRKMVKLVDRLNKTTNLGYEVLQMFKFVWDGNYSEKGVANDSSPLTREEFGILNAFVVEEAKKHYNDYEYSRSQILFKLSQDICQKCNWVDGVNYAKEMVQRSIEGYYYQEAQAYFKGYNRLQKKMLSICTKWGDSLTKAKEKSPKRLNEVIILGKELEIMQDQIEITEIKQDINKAKKYAFSENFKGSSKRLNAIESFWQEIETMYENITKLLESPQIPKMISEFLFVLTTMLKKYNDPAEVERMFITSLIHQGKIWNGDKWVLDDWGIDKVIKDSKHSMVCDKCNSIMNYSSYDNTNECPKCGTRYQWRS